MACCDCQTGLNWWPASRKGDLDFITQPMPAKQNHTPGDSQAECLNQTLIKKSRWVPDACVWTGGRAPGWGQRLSSTGQDRYHQAREMETRLICVCHAGLVAAATAAVLNTLAQDKSGSHTAYGLNLGLLKFCFTALLEGICATLNLGIQKLK